MVLKIHPETFEEVKRLSDLVCEQDGEVWMHSLDGSMMFDVRSLLSLFTMVGQDCFLVGDDHMSSKVFESLAKKSKIEVVE